MGQAGDIARRSGNRLETAMEQEGGLSPSAHPGGEPVFTRRALRFAWIPVQRVLASLGEKADHDVNSVFNGWSIEDVWLAR